MSDPGRCSDDIAQSRAHSVTNPARRRLVIGLAATTAAWMAAQPGTALSEPGPETDRIRIPATPGICVVPQYFAEGLLAAEGIRHIDYSRFDAPSPSAHLTLGTADMAMDAVGPVLTRVDQGEPMVILAGIHQGCYELFGGDRIAAVRDLKGKRLPINGVNGPQHTFLASILGYLGYDTRKDFEWLDMPNTEGLRNFTEGKVDAYLAFPPEPQALRARRIGHVLIDTSIDKPWSQYFCCVLVAHRDYVHRYPRTTRRALRAFLKATDLCASDPERMARFVVERRFTGSYDFAMDAFSRVRYDGWRTHDVLSTIRFHAVRLHELRMIRSTPQQLIDRGTDFRFLEQLKRELKA